MHSEDRSRLTFKVKYALRHPGRIARYLRRRGRDAWLQWRSPDHVSYYRAVMRSDTSRSPEAAVGSSIHEYWLQMGQLQFDYAIGHGLKPDMRMLEIGCGNLRAGRLFIDYLEPGRYYGVDISPDILISAQATIAKYDLRAKLPYLSLVKDLRLDFLPDHAFDFVHAHSVFSHSPIEVIGECLAHVGRLLAPGGFFDFTFDRTEGAEHDVLREDFYYRTQTLLDLATRNGLQATFMDDWVQTGHPQSKIRVTVPATSGPELDEGPV